MSKSPSAIGDKDAAPDLRQQGIQPNSPVDILLVEDNANDRELTIRALKKHGVASHIITVSDGAEALDFLFCRGTYSARKINNRPALILLDLKLPKLDGIEVLRAIKADDRTKTIPVVVLTSSRENTDVSACYKVGVNSYIVKPVEFGDFSKSVGQLGLYWMLLNNGPLE
jgi:two-component system, response regulator